MQKDLLNNVKVLDLSQRLPGPLGSNILRALGAEVKKIEPPGKLDAFVLFSQADPLYKFWYDQINQKKEIISMAHTYEVLKSKLAKSHIVITSKDSKIIKEITDNHTEALVVIEVCGSKDESSMHDINVLAHTQAIDLYVHHEESKTVNPPYLPFAGMAFAQQIATEALAALLKAKDEKRVVHNKVFIDETVTFIHDHFWKTDLKDKLGISTLHNGKFPCYNFYKTKDDFYIALGAVEDKFWLKFIEIFKLPLSIDDRFDTTDKTFKIIENKINTLTLSEIKSMTKNDDICLTLIDL